MFQYVPFCLISAMELALALEKLVNEKLHNLHSVICSYCTTCTLYLQRNSVFRGVFEVGKIVKLIKRVSIYITRWQLGAMILS